MSVLQEAARALLRGEFNQIEERLTAAEQTAEHYRESNSSLKAQLSSGYVPLGNTSAGEPLRSESKAQAVIARDLYIHSPIVKRGVEIQANYTFGQGINVQAPDKTINEVLQSFIDDEDNQNELTEHKNLLARERELQLDGNIFFVFFVNRRTGHVRLGSIPEGQIEEIICDPNNAKKPRFYKRVWTEKKTNYTTGATETTTENRYYPDHRYRPKRRDVFKIGSHLVDWDMPVYHVKTGGFSDWQFGYSEITAIINWVKKYEKFLGDRAKVAEILSQFPLQAHTEGGKEGVAATKDKITTTYAKNANANLTNPSNTTKIAVLGEGRTLETTQVKGATISPEEGRRLLLQVVAGFGDPETFFGDASVGTVATAESLDRPTELGFSNRQLLWLGILLTILNFVLYWAIRAPIGPLRGLAHIETDDSGREKIIWNKGVDAQVHVEFPQVVKPNSSNVIKDIMAASAKLPNGKLIAKLLLIALGQDKVDELLDEMFDEDGNPKEPLPQAVGPGQNPDAQNPVNTKPNPKDKATP